MPCEMCETILASQETNKNPGKCASISQSKNIIRYKVCKSNFRVIRETCVRIYWGCQFPTLPFPFSNIVGQSFIAYCGAIAVFVCKNAIL